MERNSSSFTNSNMKNQSIYRGTMKDSSSSSSNKVLIRDSWRNTSSMGERSVPGEELFSWPPRSYSCSFCKREFRSAQALGGHMNVHRRDRARLLRQSPPRNGQFSIFNLNLNLNQNLNPNPNPNPKPKPNFSSSSSVLSPISSTSSILFRQPFTSNLPPFGSPPLTKLSSQKWGMTKEYHSVIDHLSINSADIPSNIKNTKTFFGVGKFDGVSCVAGKESDVIKKAEIVRLNLELGIISDSKSDLDLELRLGHS